MEEIICPNCGSNDILRLAWVNTEGIIIDLFYDEENPYYQGDSCAVDNCKCFECDESFNESE